MIVTAAPKWKYYNGCYSCFQMKVLQLLLQLLPNGSTTINYGGLASRQVLTPSSVLKLSGIMPFVFSFIFDFPAIF